MLYSDNPDDTYYEPEDKRVYRIIINYEDLHKESQMLLEKYKHDYFHTVLKDRFIDSDEDDYEYWLEQQCYENAEYIEQMSDKLKNQKVSYGVLCHDYIAILKDMICKEATKKQKDISKMNAYNDCLLKFEKIFEVTKNENEKSNT